MSFMPVLQRFGSVSARMYADDHRPPHFHVVAPDFQVLVRISDLAVIAGEAPPSEIAEALACGRKHIGKCWPSNGLNSTYEIDHAEEDLATHRHRDS
ncbi:MAG: DUF4160 domain-containing protein [Methylocella sp.]